MENRMLKGRFNFSALFPFQRFNSFSLLICAVAFVEKSQIPELGNYLSPVETGLVCALVVAVGAGLCALAALIATNRYLHKDYDELFT